MKIDIEAVQNLIPPAPFSMRCILKPLILVIAVGLTSCESKTIYYCNALKSTMSSESVSAKLEAWVEENINSKDLLENDINMGGRIIPGFYSYETKFDWSLLGFDKSRSQVRLVGPRAKDIVEGKVTNIKSVFFAERSRIGVLVRVGDFDDYGLGGDAQFMTPVSANVAVLCIDVDH